MTETVENYDAIVAAQEQIEVLSKKIESEIKRQTNEFAKAYAEWQSIIHHMEGETEAALREVTGVKMDGWARRPPVDDSQYAHFNAEYSDADRVRLTRPFRGESEDWEIPAMWLRDPDGLNERVTAILEEKRRTYDEQKAAEEAASVKAQERYEQQEYKRLKEKFEVQP